jgi:hypothetical protein
MDLIASHVGKVIFCLILTVYNAMTNVQLVLHQMNALNVKRVSSVSYVIKDAPQDARTMFVTWPLVTAHARKHMLDIIAIDVFQEGLDMIATLTALKNA